MANDYPFFDRANSYILDKDLSVSTFIRYMLTRTQSMFTYTGLPDTIPSEALEKLLQTKGYCFITQVEGSLYALHGGLGGEPDVYEEPTRITVANAALKLSKDFDLQEDGVLIQNDTMRLGLLPILSKYAALLTENTLSMRTVDIILRMVCFISAGDDKTQRGAEKFIKDIVAGKLSAIAESSFFEGVRIQSIANSQNYLQQFWEMEQYLKASCFNEIGLNANYNLKREYIGSQESALNDDFLLPLVDDMIKHRQEAIDRINKKYGTEITIDFASAWKVTHEENMKQIAISQTMEGGGDNGSSPGDDAGGTQQDIRPPASPAPNDPGGDEPEGEGRVPTGDNPEADQAPPAEGDTDPADRIPPVQEIPGPGPGNGEGEDDPDGDPDGVTDDPGPEEPEDQEKEGEEKDG